MILFESRASVILFKFLKSLKSVKTFLLPANICPIVPVTFLKAQVPFEFIDISYESLCINEEIAFERIRVNPNKYGGVLFNHTYGIDYSPVIFFKRLKIEAPFLKLIDDRCLCIPTLTNSPEEGDETDLILYSTGYSKYADVGFGGIGITKGSFVQKETFPGTFRPEDLLGLQHDYQKSINCKSNFEFKDSNWLDCRIPDISYDDYVVKVNSMIERAKGHKHNLNLIFSANIGRTYQYSSEFQNWRFNIKVPDKEVLLRKIFRENLFASSLYHSLGDGILSVEHFPVASFVHNETINLFNDFNFNEDKAISICKIINQHTDN